MDLSNLNLQSLNQLIITFASRILLSITILVVGLNVIKRVIKLIQITFERINLDKSLKSFLLSIIKVCFQILLIITIASMLGAEMTSFVAIIGSAGLAIGLALQGSLSNFAGGVLILVLKPFKAGDYIEAAGYSGTVEEIQVFYTILNTPDNKKVIIPNSNLSNSGTINYSANPTRRVDFIFGVGYEDDIFKVKETLQKIANEHPLIFKDPEPQIVLGKHDASSINFFFRVWVKTEDYWKVHFDIMEIVKIEFDREGINIPYPQMDVHIHKED